MSICSFNGGRRNRKFRKIHMEKEEGERFFVSDLKYDLRIKFYIYVARAEFLLSSLV